MTDNIPPSIRESELEEALKAFEVAILDVVGDEFAPKQEHGSPERKRLLGLIAKIHPESVKTLASVKALMTKHERELLETVKALIDPLKDRAAYANPDMQDKAYIRNKAIEDVLDAIDAELRALEGGKG